MVRLAEGRIVAENISMHATCQAVALKAGSFMAHSPSMDLSLTAARETSQNLCLTIFAADNARLRRENLQLRDTNKLLKATSAFFASKPDPQR